jgi:hypothetical protein
MAVDVARDRLLDAAVVLVGRGMDDDLRLAARVLGAGPSPALLDELRGLVRVSTGERRAALAGVLDRAGPPRPVGPSVMPPAPPRRSRLARLVGRHA